MNVEELKRNRKRKNQFLLLCSVLILSAACYISNSAFTALKRVMAPTATSTSTPTVTEVLYPTHTVTPTPTPTLTPVPTKVIPLVVAGEDGVNLREGPGTIYLRLGYLEPGATAEVVGWYGNWWKTLRGWVYSELVTAYNIENIPQVDPPPASIEAPATLTLTPEPGEPTLSTLEPTEIAIPPTPTPICDCSNNLYNCPDFATQNQAQTCFDYCVSIGRGDIHDLDGDGDGKVCESLP